MTHHPLQFTADEQVEHLVRAPEFHVRFDHHGVVGLHQRIEHLGDCDRLVLGVAVGEVLPVEELVDGEPAGQFDHVGQCKFAEPLALPFHLRAVPVHDLEELAHVGFGVFQDLGVGEHRAGCRAAGGVTNLRGPVAHDQDHLVPEILQLPEFSQPNHVTQVNVRPAGIKPHFQAQRCAPLQHGGELVLRDDPAYTAPRDGGKVFGDLNLAGQRSPRLCWSISTGGSGAFLPVVLL